MSDRGAASILIVDDDPGIRELLADALSDGDLRVRVAASGQEAAEAVERERPDILVTDLCLAGESGAELIDRLRSQVGHIPTVVITGQGDPSILAEASRRRPLELMTKPLDLPRLKGLIRSELARRDGRSRQARRHRRLRHLARQVNLQRKDMHRRLESTSDDLAAAYRTLTEQLAVSQVALDYHRELLGASNDDDVFRNLFRAFVTRSGGTFGIAMVCNADAELQIVGRFGVPAPDGLTFCQGLCQGVVGQIIANPKIMLMDAGENADLFPQSIRRYLCGLTILAVPLVPAEGEIIGMAILYRKGEQPFVDSDISLAETIATPTAICIKRND